MSAPVPLLAKSWNTELLGNTPPTWARLVPHLRAVERAGGAIVDSIGRQVLQRLDLPAEPWLARLADAVDLAAQLHDIGKANDAFQGMVRGELDGDRQPVRHELLSALALIHDWAGFGSWLRWRLIEHGWIDVIEPMFDAVVASVGAHHFKLDEDWSQAAPAAHGGGFGRSLAVLLSHPELKRAFEGRPDDGDISLPLASMVAPDSLARLKVQFQRQSQMVCRRLAAASDWRRFGSAVKGLTAAADVVGSAMLPSQEPIADWVSDSLSATIRQGELLAVAHARLAGATPRSFQEEIAQTDSRITLVEAGCGTGKTVAAYLWGERHAVGGRLFFCYPTTGTATEGFLGYVAETELEAKLVHSRSLIDLEGVAPATEEHKDERMHDQRLRIESLSCWGAQVVVCTADMVLSLVRMQRRGLYNSPAILTGAFVFDELHAYDDRMLGAVVALVEALPGAQFLLMSASLPPDRKSWLLERISGIREVTAPEALERIPRYVFGATVDSRDAVAQAVSMAGSGGKILWVSNTVSRAQAMHDRFRKVGVACAAYHSRFKYMDRTARHREVVGTFATPGRGGFVALTTQVAEMSLDLDADLLITDIAPIHALVQRLGRLNRRVSEFSPGSPRTVLFIEPNYPKPYSDEDLTAARDWIALLRGRPMSQRDISDVFHRIAAGKPTNVDTRSEWLDSGWTAVPGPIRESSASVTVLLEEDIQAVWSGGAPEATRRAIPMAWSARMGDWTDFRGMLVAPTGRLTYDAYRGAAWPKR